MCFARREMGFFVPEKIFLIFFKFGVSFFARFSAVGKCGVQKPRRTLTIEYTFIRYVAWAGRKPKPHEGTPRPTCRTWDQRDIRGGATPKPIPKYPVATDTAMTDPGYNDTSLRSGRRTRQR